MKLPRIHFDQSSKVEIKSAFIITLKEFCASTGQHAYVFIFNPLIRLYEKLLWLLVLVIAISFSLYVVLNTWFDYKTNPTFTMIISTQHPISEIKFPGISICSNNKISKQRAVAYSKEL